MRLDAKPAARPPLPDLWRTEGLRWGACSIRDSLAAERGSGGIALVKLQEDRIKICSIRDSLVSAKRWGGRGMHHIKLEVEIIKICFGTDLALTFVAPELS